MSIAEFIRESVLRPRLKQTGALVVYGASRRIVQGQGARQEQRVDWVVGVLGEVLEQFLDDLARPEPRLDLHVVLLCKCHQFVT